MLVRFRSSLPIWPGLGTFRAATQNQALSALLFLYQQVLKQEVGWVHEVERAKRPKRIPSVLTRDEVHKIFAHCTERRD